MKLVSLNIGQPQEHEWNGQRVNTSIFKWPVAGKRKVSFRNIEGDAQANLKVHGGINKAVYAYDLSHYEHWNKVPQRTDWPYGLFGENLTTEGLPDNTVRIGDVYRIGTAWLRVVQPRFPCTKLNVRFARPDMMERFMQEKRNGIYFSVQEEGWLEAGDRIVLEGRSPYAVTVQEYVDCYATKGKDKALVETILAIPFLPQSQRKAFAAFRR